MAKFYEELAADMFEASNQHWLVMRTTFNHLLLMFATKPHLMSVGFSNFLVNFSICREIRALDSQIHLHRMETLLPQVLPKEYEQLSLHEISQEGAYVRCMTLIVGEGMVNGIQMRINCLSAEQIQQDSEIHQVLNALEQILLRLF